MYVRLALAWIDPGGAVHNAGDVVDIDAVTLAELEEQGVVEDPNSPTRDDGDAEQVSKLTSSSKIGPGPGAPPTDTTEKIGPGPGAPPKDTAQKIGPGPGSID